MLKSTMHIHFFVCSESIMYLLSLESVTYLQLSVSICDTHTDSHTRLEYCSHEEEESLHCA